MGVFKETACLNYRTIMLFMDLDYDNIYSCPYNYTEKEDQQLVELFVNFF